MKQRDLSIYYDGKCPVCSQYVRHARLQRLFRVSLYDLRKYPEQVTAFTEQGFDVDRGMIVTVDGQIYHGADAMHMVGLLSTPSNIFNRCNQLVFSHKRLAKILYPVLLRGRNLLLALRRQKKIIAD